MRRYVQDSMQAYKVLLVIKDAWWSDQQEFPTFAAARKHQAEVERKWTKTDTAIAAPDGRVLNFHDWEMIQLEKDLAVN